ncbi:LLM class F420-dependent oxidoreductase [Streptomyces sp. NEAU-sy36]|uniref:LLM class F420-dependent oxidoreductase n=1 Tax=unclassified Streptomyces TaxID=2593676 RepID=UPI0015D62117|nr:MULTISPECIES: LLM class F420-dependent oxidoreductase [unclassified Streptomyces]QLJ04037.1 LLM class F420-dependent oxidoreductase [Streptomyces sp. NEAU-sy36]
MAAAVTAAAKAPRLGPLGIWSFQLDPQPMARARDAAAELDDLGFGALWVPEAVAREPFANAALLLQATTRMTVATGIASLHARTAMTMNAGWRTLSEAFPGRFLLGVGVSHQSMVEGNHNATYGTKPYSTMIDYLDRMDAGTFFGAPAPVAPQRVLAALGPRMLRLAAERGAGAHTYFVPVEHTTVARAALGEGALLAPEQTVVFETDPGVARRVARRFMKRYLELPNYTGNLRRLGWGEEDLGGGGSDRLVDALVAWGSLDEIAARVQAHLDAGADHVCVQVQTEDPRDSPMAQWRELASIIPSLRTRRAASPPSTH